MSALAAAPAAAPEPVVAEPKPAKAKSSRRKVASEPVVEFVVGFINALLAAVTFVGILFWVGGSLTVTITITALVFVSSTRIQKALGDQAITALERLMGLVLVVPMLGHASWHAYRDTIDASALPERESGAR